MKRLLIFVPLVCLAGLLTAGCERGVRADREGPDTFQPRPAKVPDPKGMDQGEERGELTRVDLTNTAITLRASNGMDQTFRVDDRTKVKMLGTLQVQKLMGMEGSEVVVSWKMDTGAKTATKIEMKRPGQRELLTPPEP